MMSCDASTGPSDGDAATVATWSRMSYAAVDTADVVHPDSDFTAMAFRCMVVPTVSRVRGPLYTGDAALGVSPSAVV